MTYTLKLGLSIYGVLYGTVEAAEVEPGDTDKVLAECRRLLAGLQPAKDICKTVFKGEV